MLVGAVGEPNSGGIGRRLHIVHVSRHRYHYLVMGLGRISKAVWTAVLHRRCIGCSRPFSAGPLRRKRREGAGAIAAGPAAWSVLPIGQAGVTDSLPQASRSFRPESLQDCQDPRAGEHGGLAWDFPCPSTENPALEKQPFAGSSQPATLAALRGHCMGG